VIARDSSPVRTLACRIRLGLADWRDVERVGIQQLALGASQPEVVALASVTSATRELQSLVDAAVVAMGDSVPDVGEAAIATAVDTAHQIVNGAVAAVNGARSIWTLARQVPEVEPLLTAFIGLASEWEDDEVNRRAYENDIVEAAKQLINDHG
jgi:hypothetical protein